MQIDISNSLAKDYCMSSVKEYACVVKHVTDHLKSGHKVPELEFAGKIIPVKEIFQPQ